MTSRLKLRNGELHGWFEDASAWLILSLQFEANLKRTLDVQCARVVLSRKVTVFDWLFNTRLDLPNSLRTRSLRWNSSAIAFQYMYYPIYAVIFKVYLLLRHTSPEACPKTCMAAIGEVDCGVWLTEERLEGKGTADKNGTGNGIGALGAGKGVC